MSKEHVWPDWLKHHVPKEFTGTMHRVSVQGEPLSSSGRPTKTIAGKLNRPGDPKSQRLRVVCTACNNTWMSQLQSRTKAALLSLILGNWHPLTADEQHQISAWCTMFTMVLEYADEKTVVVPQSHRDIFRASHLPPPGWRVFIAPYAGGRNGSFWHRPIGLEPLNEADAVTFFQSTLAVVGKLAFYVVSCSKDDEIIRNFTIDPWIPLCQIWPVIKRNVVLPFRTFDDVDYNDMSVAIMNLVLRDVSDS